MKTREKQTYFDRIHDLFYALETAYEATDEERGKILESLMTKIREFCSKTGKTNLVVTDLGAAKPVWLVALMATELAFQDASLAELKPRLLSTLDELRQIEKPEYKRYRGGITAFSVPLDYGCYVVPLVLIEDGLDVTLEKEPPLVTAILGFGLERMNERQHALFSKLIDLGLGPNQGESRGV